MGKKGVLLDNGKQAQSSMALYWKAGRDRASGKVEKPQKEVKEEKIEDRVEGGKDKWKTHKEKMINKLYNKPVKKEDEAELKKQQAEKEKRQEEELDRELLEKALNKNKPTYIPGFGTAKQLQSKKQYQEVHVGKEESNKLILPAGQQPLTHEEIVRMLRESKAKKQMEHKQRVAVRRPVEHHFDMLMNEKQPEKEPEPLPEPQPAPVEEKSIFKSELLQRLERGEKLHPAKPVQPQKVQEVEEPKQFVPKFIPRALWQK